MEAYDYYTTMHALFDGSLHIGRGVLSEWLILQVYEGWLCVWIMDALATIISHEISSSQLVSNNKALAQPATDLER